MTTATAPAVRWDWSGAARGVPMAAPAAVVATYDVQLAAVLAVGVIPSAILPLAPRRRERLRATAVGCLAGVSILVGALLALWPPLAVLGLFVAAVVASRLSDRRAAGMLVLNLCLPLMGVGLSYPGWSPAAGLALTIVLGSTWALMVSLCWPERPVSPPVAPAVLPPRELMVRYGYLAGATGAVCAGVGFALDLEHVGWATAAALLVMRPQQSVQRMRSLDRVGDVVLGAALAILLAVSNAPAWTFAVVIALVVVAATATASSRRYLTPMFTTLLVFVLLVSEDPGQARGRFWERVLETGFGVAVAALLGLLAPALLARRREPQGIRDGPEAR